MRPRLIRTGRSAAIPSMKRAISPESAAASISAVRRASAAVRPSAIPSGAAKLREAVSVESRSAAQVHAAIRGTTSAAWRKVNPFPAIPPVFSTAATSQNARAYARATARGKRAQSPRRPIRSSPPVAMGWSASTTSATHRATGSSVAAIQPCHVASAAPSTRTPDAVIVLDLDPGGMTGRPRLRSPRRHWRG